MKSFVFKFIILFAIVITSFSTLSQNSSISSLVLSDMDGKSHNVNQIINNGKSVVFVFWQTWCATCIREAPSIVKAAIDNSDSMRFFGIVSGTDEDVDDTEVRQKAKKLKLPYPQIRDRNLSITTEYEVKGTPTIIILGPGKKVLYYNHRPPKDWQSFHNSSKSN